MPFLVFFGRGGELFVERLDGRLTIGGTDAADLVLPAPDLAPVQVEIARDAGGWRAVDRAGGTPDVALDDGAEIALGAHHSARFVTRLPDRDETPRTLADGLPAETLPEELIVAARRADGTGPSMEVPLQGRVTVGSGRGAALRLEDPTVSAEHGSFTREHDRIVFADRSRTNGTAALGFRKVYGGEIELGTRLRIGPFEVWVAARDRPDAEEMAVGEFLTRDPACKRALARAVGAAPSDEPVVIHGETGTGKELIARIVHEHSRRAAAPYVTENCATLSGNTADSRLFGSIEGVFTDVKTKPGLLALADGGTLFLDEVADVQIETQAKLLRFLEDGTYRPVGSAEERRADVRIVVASHVALEDAVAAGRFRQDLLYRLDVVRLRVPPLAQRPADVVPLLQRFIADRARSGMEIRVTAAARRKIEAHDWPGNVRELRNLARRILSLRKAVIEESDVELGPRRATAVPAGPRPGARTVDPVGLTDAQIRAQAYRIVADHHRGNRSAAAEALGIDRSTLARWLGET